MHSADFTRSSIPEEHRRALHVCTDANEIERLFPSPSSAPMEADTSATASSDSVITPEQERRVFTYIAEEEEEDEHNPVTQLAHSQSAKHTVSTAMRTESASPIGVNGRKSLLSSNMIQTPLKPRGVGPTITPRLSKAAALRMGVPLPEVTPRRPATAESDRLNDRPLPGITRRPVTPPKSLAKPGITPRGTKASLLRQEGAGGSVNDSFTVRQPTKRRESCGTSERSSMYEGLAGFGNRRRSVASTSTASSQVRAKVAVPNGLDMSETIGRGLSWKPHAPTVPRAALSTAERAAQSAASSGRSLPGIDRRSSVSSLMQPSIQPRVNRATALRNGMDGEDGDRRSSVRSPHSNGRATPSLSSRASPLPPSDRSDGLRSPPPAVRPPSITPRVNRAAELRMAQMAK